MTHLFLEQPSPVSVAESRGLSGGDVLLSNPQDALTITKSIGTKDSILPYRVPDGGDSNGRFLSPGQEQLNDLMQQIQHQAIEHVQDRMTPEQLRQLNQDAAKYEREYKAYEHAEMVGTGGLLGVHHTPPEMPPSLQQYNRAVDAEIAKIIKGR